MDELIPTHTDTNALQRRHFLALTARTGVLAALGGLASVLAAKRAALRREGLCPESAMARDCRQCSRYASCSFPQAVSQKQTFGMNHGQ